MSETMEKQILNLHADVESKLGDVIKLLRDFKTTEFPVPRQTTSVTFTKLDLTVMLDSFACYLSTAFLDETSVAEVIRLASIYKELARMQFEWDRCNLFLLDVRCCEDVLVALNRKYPAKFDAVRVFANAEVEKTAVAEKLEEFIRQRI